MKRLSSWLSIATVCLLSIQSGQCQQYTCPYDFDLMFLLGTDQNICQNQPDLQSVTVPGSAGPCATCSNWRSVLTFATTIVNSFQITPNNTRVAVVLFGNTASVAFYLNTFTSYSAVADYINNNLCYPSPSLGMTSNLNDALNLTLTAVMQTANGRRAQTQGLIIAFSSGTSPEDPTIIARFMRRTLPVTIATLGVTPSADVTQLTNAASAPGFYFYTDQFATMVDQIPAMTPQECKPLNVTALNSTACHNVLDICFLIDVSGSICDADPTTRRTYVSPDDGQTYATCGNWQLVQLFLRQLVASFIIGPNDVQIGAIAFGNNARMLWYLNTYETNAGVDRAINLIKYSALGENTATADALALAYSTCYSTQFGKRPNVPDVTIVVTDGKPTVNVDQTQGNAIILQNDNRYGVVSEIVTVGISSAIDPVILCQIASPTGPVPNVNITCFYQPDFSGLERIFLSIQSLVCSSFGPAVTVAPTTQLPPSRNCSQAVDVVFVVDQSDSIGSQNFAIVQTFLSNLIMQMNIDNGVSRVGLLLYSSTVRIIFNLNTYSSRVNAADAVLNIPYYGGTTSTADALSNVTDVMFTVANGDRAGAMNLVIVITDGGSNDKQATVTQAIRAKTSKDIQIVSVGVGNWIDINELTSIASYPAAVHFLNISGYQNLSQYSDTFFNMVCNQIDECATTVCLNGGTCVDLINSYWCECPPGIGGRNCEIPCRVPSDVAFVLDASTSITQANFVFVTNFVTDVVLMLPVDNTYKIALETFSNRASVIFNFQFATKRQTLDAITRLYYFNQRTNTSDALALLRTNIFNTANGYVSSIPATAIVITDGYSDVPANTWAQAIQARAQGINLISIGVTKSINVQELVNIASYPANIVNGLPTPNAFVINTFSNLTALESVVVSTVCSQTDMCAATPSPCLNGGTCSSNMNAYSCTCTDYTQFSGKNCQFACSGVADVAFVIDVSGSTRSEIFPQVQQAFVWIAEQLKISPTVVQLAAVTGTTTGATVNFNLGTYTTSQDASQAIRQLKYVGGKSNIPLLLSTARTQVFGTAADRPTAPNFIVLFTNVGGVLDTQAAATEAVNVKNANIRLIIISIGTDVNVPAFQQMASYPPTTSQLAVRYVANYTLLPPFVNGAMCRSVNNCAGVTCNNGGTCRDIFSDYICDCVADSVGRHCNQTGCSRTEDVLIINDMSYSQAGIQQAQQQIIRYLVYNINFNRINLALITYSNNATVQFRLGQWTTRQQYLNALTYPQTTGLGRTNTQDALTQANTVIFQTANGARPGVFQRVILLTNGGSNIVQPNTIPSAQVLRNRNITVNVIVVGQEENLGEVDSIASVPSGNYTFKFPTAAVDYTRLDPLIQSMCN